MNERPTHVDLYAGIGGFSLALAAEGFRTVAYSEFDPIKQLVYRRHFPDAESLGQVENIRGADVVRAHGPIDVVTGGVPCQPASAIGQMRGSLDERWLWPETIRLVGEIRPVVAKFENPASILVLESGRAWNGIVSGLVALGYDCWWDVFPAAAAGAGHLRERIILVCADPDQAGLEGYAGNGGGVEEWQEQGGSVAPPDLRERVSSPDWWRESVTGIPVLAHGLSPRLVRAASECAGDSVVPQIIRPIARAIRRCLLK